MNDGAASGWWQKRKTEVEMDQDGQHQRRPEVEWINKGRRHIKVGEDEEEEDEEECSYPTYTDLPSVSSSDEFPACFTHQWQLVHFACADNN